MCFSDKKHQTCKTGSEATVFFAWSSFIKCDSLAMTIWMKIIKPHHNHYDVFPNGSKYSQTKLKVSETSLNY
jgi:hypothetical protein